MSDKVNAAMYEENNATVSFFFKPETNEYKGFKKDLANGAGLQDAEGNVIDGIIYLETLS
jgi:hypothetical protein